MSDIQPQLDTINEGITRLTGAVNDLVTRIQNLPTTGVSDAEVQELKDEAAKLDDLTTEVQGLAPSSTPEPPA